MKYSVLFSSPCSVIPLFIFCLCIVPVVLSQCLEHQKTLLLQLKQSLQFNSSSSTNLVTWNSDNDCCRWGGVTCDPVGRVTGLDLNTESISGGINSSSSPLFRLQYLKTLNLANNVFNDVAISSGFGRLSNLRYLNLSSSGFSGQIPIEISYLTRLVTLDISSYGLKLKKPNLDKLVQNLTDLIELHLDGVNISAMGVDWCRALSSSLPNLQVLSLSYCDLSGPICSSLQNLHSLSAIDLSHNWGLYGPVPDFFANFENLTHLDLSYCGFNGTFPEKIFQLSTLQTVDLEYNEELRGSLPEFPHDGSLQTLSLGDTNFSGRLPNSIGSLGKLSFIWLDSCSFSGPIPNSVANLTQLVDADLSYNMFTGPIPSSLFQIPSLQTLDLSSNQFGGRVEDFSNASSARLETLDLSSNSLQGPIPLSFFKLANLTRLSLSSNNFSGTVRLQEIHRLCSLSELNLSNNSLSIDTTDSNSTLSCTPSLGTLSLASCKQETFPDLRTLSSLSELDLSDNQISGELPNWIWKVGLSQLNLSHNVLNGLQEPYVFPTDQLISLDLHSNQLRGEIPMPHQQARTSYMDYSDNNFSSTIPVDVGNNLNQLVFFSLSNNSITGTIPQSLCNASDLQFLDLSNNDLGGTIPSCLVGGHTIELELLNLRNNKLGGYIPATFQESCGLKALYLDGNHLGGRVPKSLGNCKELEVLNLGKNDINDRFPCFLQNVSSLQILVLQGNRFHGDIRCDGEQGGGWPNLTIIDLSFNSFDGILSPTFFSTWRAMMHGNSEVKYLRIGGEYGNSEVKTVLTPRVCEPRYGCGRPAANLINYYYIKVTIINKGSKIEFERILPAFLFIDFSSNRFDGKIPNTIGDLKFLHSLNLSSNAFTGTVPSSLGNLTDLESLDLSQNKLSGRIPEQLASLRALSVLNLSYNLLVGRIPTGSQLRTFPDTSFQGNKGLCGAPLINQSCKETGNNGVAPLPPPHDENEHSSFLEADVYISAEVGFVVGLAFTMGPIVFSGRWRHRFYRQVDRFVCRNTEQRRRQWRAHVNRIRRLQ